MDIKDKIIDVLLSIPLDKWNKDDSGSWVCVVNENVVLIEVDCIPPSNRQKAKFNVNGLLFEVKDEVGKDCPITAIYNHLQDGEKQKKEDAKRKNLEKLYFSLTNTSE